MKHHLSRRHLLKTSLALPFHSLAAPADRPVLAYVGSYSSPQGPEGSKGNGKGIYLFQMNPSSGELTPRNVFEDRMNPSWLALHPSRRFLYAANEVSDFNTTQSGAVTAYSIETGSGRLIPLNTVASEGAGPAHLSVHPGGKFVLVANYFGGSFAVLPIQADGRLQPASDIQSAKGAVGSQHAASAPAGSFAISGHDRPHAHMIEASPDGEFVFGSDLGTDKIHIWNFDAAAGQLKPAATPFVPVPSGDGPRHFVFHPNGRWFYSLQEEASTIIRFDYEPTAGKLTPQQQLSTLPRGFSGTNFTSEIRISADGRTLYAANRLHDSIAWFAIGPSGSLTLAGETWTRGDYPRSFTIDPSGRFLYSCNQRSDAVACFRIDRQTGKLTFTDQYTPVGTPSIIVFLS
jgi:6-phosphogluconolactonase (cycloisomerase 2 family)